tara:strand:+ start:1246 stop:1632 length:387 start_codon:yes stop_codon:yes gene_type:complete
MGNTQTISYDNSSSNTNNEYTDSTNTLFKHQRDTNNKYLNEQNKNNNEKYEYLIKKNNILRLNKIKYLIYFIALFICLLIVSINIFSAENSDKLKKYLIIGLLILLAIEIGLIITDISRIRNKNILTK